MSARRRASRLMVLDHAGRVLLFQYAHPTGERYWATPGGGLEEGETFETAAAREAAEELGIEGVLLRSLWEGTATLRSGVVQTERFFLAEGAGVQLGRSAPDREREGVLQIRWWSLAELESCADQVFPEGLAIRLGDRHLSPRRRGRRCPSS